MINKETTTAEIEAIKSEIVPENHKQLDLLDLQASDATKTEIEMKLSTISTIAAVIKASLKSGINNDYAVIPGTGTKPTLLQPGARKICLLFGLTPTFKIESSYVNYDAPFSFERRGKSRTTSSYITETKTSLGTFNYVMSCEIRNADGKLISTGWGQCTNREVGKQDAPENTILKICKKRALVDAVLGIANMTEAFTQDLEDYKKY